VDLIIFNHLECDDFVPVSIVSFANEDDYIPGTGQTPLLVRFHNKRVTEKLTRLCYTANILAGRVSAPCLFPSDTVHNKKVVAWLISLFVARNIQHGFET